MSRFGPRYRGRHRKPSTTGNTIAKTALAGAVVSAPLVTAGQAQAAPDNVWDRVAQCESGGNWGISTGNGFQGGLQFTQSTWRSFGGSQFASTANRASREEQIVIAEKVLAGQGWNAWPVCSRKAGARGSSATQRTVAVKAPAKAHPAKPTPRLGTRAHGTDRPAETPAVPVIPAPRQPSEQLPAVRPAVQPPAPAAPPALAPLLAAATQPDAKPAPALTALPQAHRPADTAAPGVVLAAAPPAIEKAAPAPAPAPVAAAPAPGALAAVPAPVAAPAPAEPKHAAAAPAPAGQKHAAPAPVAAPAPAGPKHAAPAPVAGTPGAGHTYLVRPGDTLSGIATAQRVPGGWQSIYEANRGGLHSANLIRPGQQLNLG
ncbi:MAG: resuscitation-promoting factor RpfA [Pseudonocardiales bacterium]|nr:resuscitation-promoting factor RpfA [Pseudonocardiales bacterium]